MKIDVFIVTIKHIYLKMLKNMNRQIFLFFYYFNIFQIKKYTDSPYIEKIFAQTRKKNKNSHFNNKGEFTLQEIKEKVKETKETENVTEFRSKSVEINKTKFSIKKRAHSLNIINEEFYKDKKPEEILKDFVFRKNNYLTN